MKGWIVAATAVFSFSVVTVSMAQSAVPAWQEPDFVMEEVVVAATVEKAVLPAWQRPGFVMEEVVATATVEDVANASRGRMHQRARLLIAQIAREDSAE